MNSKIKITISKKLHEKILARTNDLGFASVEDCIEFVMNEFIPDSPIKNPENNNIDEEKLIKERFRSLGYL